MKRSNLERISLARTELTLDAAQVCGFDLHRPVPAALAASGGPATVSAPASSAPCVASAASAVYSAAQTGCLLWKAPEGLRSPPAATQQAAGKRCGPLVLRLEVRLVKVRTAAVAAARAAAEVECRAQEQQAAAEVVAACRAQVVKVAERSLHSWPVEKQDAFLAARSPNATPTKFPYIVSPAKRNK